MCVCIGLQGREELGGRRGGGVRAGARNRSREEQYTHTYMYI